MSLSCFLHKQIGNKRMKKFNLSEILGIDFSYGKYYNLSRNTDNRSQVYEKWVVRSQQAASDKRINVWDYIQWYAIPGRSESFPNF